MARRPRNPELVNLVRLLRKRSREMNIPLWRAIAEKLNRSRRRRIVVNLSRINRCTSLGDIVMVPGKVLGFGQIDHAVTVAAFRFSSQAKDKIIAARGKVLSILELMEENPSGRNIKIIS